MSMRVWWSEQRQNSTCECWTVLGNFGACTTATFKAEWFTPDGTYKDVKGVETVAVGAQWTTTSKQPDDLVYEITKALWSDKTRALLDAGHAKGKEIRKETALQGISIPLHPGAEKFYKEAGLLK